MDIKGYRHVPNTLFDSITFLAQAFPKRSVPTFLELLFGAMLTQTGFVTDAVLAVDSLRHSGSYYKWLQCGKWSWVALGRQTVRLALRTFHLVSRKWISSLPEVSMECFVYGKTQIVSYRSAIVLARFLNGRPVRIVWSQLLKDDGSRSPPSLILSTGLSLSAARVILNYGRRWSIEDLFNQPKNRWGWKET